ncbi:MAG: acetate kinase [Pseudomonadota bacterium]|nr:acetate kinase [Pseudomonadota bacterium]
MNKRNRLLSIGTIGYTAIVFAAAPALAQTNTPSDDPDARLSAMKQRIDEQTRQLNALKQALAEQEARIDEMRRALGAEALAGQRGGAGTGSGSGSQQIAQAPTPVGQAPDESTRRPEVAPIFEQPGVLTPKGKYVLEPSLQYSYSSSNRISLVGYTIIPAILIGAIDIREIRRTTVTGALTGRFGVSNRFELEAKVPYVYRADTSVGREILQGTASNSIFDTTGHGLGDVELTGRYQFNDGGLERPYYIGSLRFKSRTGKDPFEVQTSKNVIGFRDDGVQTELPTGSGFYGLQPAVTMLYPSDPAVFFGTVSYLYTFARSNVSRNTDNGPEFLGKVAPGGIFGFNFGMGLGLNEKSSFSIGYDHASVGKTKVEGSAAPDSVRVQLGTLLLGYSYRLGDKRTLNVSLGAGLTRDTPDVTLTVRMPMTF